jgi:hypothetical protein
MAGNGKPNSDDSMGDFTGMFPGVDFDPSLFSDMYVSYEQVVGTLMWACMQNRLRLYSVANTLDTNSLEREFKACCVPREWEPPYQMRAEIGFYWPAEYTPLSMDGDDAFCTLYHDDDEPCEHEPGSAEIFTELEIEYHLPYDFVQEVDSDAGIEAVARQIRRSFTDLVDHDNIVAVDVQAAFTADELVLSGIHAHHFWMLDDELHNLPQLAAVLLSICDEINRVLLRFAQEFSGREEPTTL